MLEDTENICNSFVDFSKKRRGLGTYGLCLKFEKGCQLAMAIQRRKAQTPKHRFNTQRFMGENSDRK